MNIDNERYDTLQGVLIRRPGVSLRAARPEDLPAWRAVAADVAEIFGNPNMADDPEFISYAERKITQNEALVAEICGETAGFIGFSRRFNRITWLGVPEKHRAKGAGGALLSAVLAQLDASNDITVETFREGFAPGRAARDLYMKHGFVERASDLRDHLGNERCLLVIAARPS